MEYEQRLCRISNLTGYKIIEDKRAKTYVSVPKFVYSVPIPSYSPHTRLNSL